MHASCSLKTQNTMVHMSEFHWDVRLKRIDALCIGQWSCLARRWKAEKKFVIEPSIPLICLCSDLRLWFDDGQTRCQMTCLETKMTWLETIMDFSSKRQSTAELEGVEWNLYRAKIPSLLACLSNTRTYQIPQRFTPKVKILHPLPLWNFVPLLVLWTDKFPLLLTQAPPSAPLPWPIEITLKYCTLTLISSLERKSNIQCKIWNCPSHPVF